MNIVPMGVHSIIRFNSFFLLFFLLLIHVPFASAADEGKDLQKLTVEGRSSLSLPDPKKEALRNAFVAAVEQAVGVQVKSETLVENMLLIKDKILTKSEGYVRKWDITREYRDANAYVVEVIAWVTSGMLNKDLFLNGIDVEQVYDWTGKPRVLVLITEHIDNKKTPTSFAQTEVESILLSKGIKVLRSEQLEKIAQRDATLAFSDPKKAVSLGQRFGAEIVITGKCISRFSRELNIAGYKQIFYSSLLETKAYRTSNAELLMSKIYTESPGEQDTSAMGKSDASMRSIQGIVRSNAKNIVHLLVKNWFEGMSKSKIYQVIISGVKNTDVSKIIQAVNDMPDVVRVFKRSFNLGTAEIEIEYNGLQSTLSDILENNEILPLLLTNDEPFRLFYEKKK
jgi:hypothetical protein